MNLRYKSTSSLEYLRKILWTCSNCCCLVVTRACMLSRIWAFVTSWTVACKAPLSMGFPRQEYWTRLPFSSPGDLPNPGIEPTSPAFQADFSTTEPSGKSCLVGKQNLPPSSVSLWHEKRCRRMQDVFYLPLNYLIEFRLRAYSRKENYH